MLSSFSITKTKGTLSTKKKFTSGELIFEDNFEKFDTNKWQHDPNGKSHLKEFQWYTNSWNNTFVKNGILHIKPTLFEENADLFSICSETHGGQQNFYPIRSARISTRTSFAFKYGFIEVNAKIPLGDWLFPAIWMMPYGDTYTKNWPQCGEIDIMEAAGNKELVSRCELIGVQRVSSTLHWGPNKTLNKYKLTQYTKHDPALFSSSFHKYQFKWTPDNITFLVDGEETGFLEVPNDGGFWKLGNFSGTGLTNPWANGTKMAPFDQEFFIILNLAVGGTAYFSDNSANAGGKPWKNDSPTASLDFWKGRKQWLPTWNMPSDQSHFQIDYVRVWAL